MKEHVIMILLMLATYLPIAAFHNLAANKAARKLVLWVAGLVILIGMAMDGSGAIIGLGVKEVEEKEEYSKADERDLTFVGLLCFIDPLKPTAKESIDELKWEAWAESRRISEVQTPAETKICPRRQMPDGKGQAHLALRRYRA
jgi:hypothetical protein